MGIIICFFGVTAHQLILINNFGKSNYRLYRYNPGCRMCNFRKDTLPIEAFMEEIRLQAERAMTTFQNRMSAEYKLITHHPERKVEFCFENYEQKE